MRSARCLIVRHFGPDPREGSWRRPGSFAYQGNQELAQRKVEND